MNMENNPEMNQMRDYGDGQGDGTSNPMQGDEQEDEDDGKTLSKRDPDELDDVEEEDDQEEEGEEEDMPPDGSQSYVENSYQRQDEQRY